MVVSQVERERLRGRPEFRKAVPLPAFPTPAAHIIDPVSNLSNASLTFVLHRPAFLPFTDPSGCRSRPVLSAAPLTLLGGTDGRSDSSSPSPLARHGRSALEYLDGL